LRLSIGSKSLLKLIKGIRLLIRIGILAAFGSDFYFHQPATRRPMVSI